MGISLILQAQPNHLKRRDTSNKMRRFTSFLNAFRMMKVVLESIYLQWDTKLDFSNKTVMYLLICTCVHAKINGRFCGKLIVVSWFNGMGNDLVRSWSIGSWFSGSWFSGSSFSGSWFRESWSRGRAPYTTAKKLVSSQLSRIAVYVYSRRHVGVL